jgi:hypothetical protein
MRRISRVDTSTALLHWKTVQRYSNALLIDPSALPTLAVMLCGALQAGMPPNKIRVIVATRAI